MIIDTEDFLKEVDIKFWNSITKKLVFKDVISYRDVKRIKFLKELSERINNFEHHFSKPDYFYLPKGSGVLRKIKSYAIADIVIYYYCVKKIQDPLITLIKKNERVFGAFKFTANNQTSQADFNVTDENDYSGNYESFLAGENAKLDWKEFQSLAKEASEKNFNKYVHIDIAHFYDDINLDILNKEIRNIAKNQTNVIDLLFHFLSFSDKRDLGYSPSNVGIPQEELGDMSRVLANFYLASFDRIILTFLSGYFKKKDFIYMRYSDDMWFCFNGDAYDAYNIIQEVSSQLEKLKLHINEKKICIYSKSEFIDHWFFTQWGQIARNKNDIIYLLKLYNSLITGEKSGRWYSLASYILKIIASKRKHSNQLKTYNERKKFIFSLIENPDLINKMKPEHYPFFYEILKSDRKLFFDLKKFIQSKKNIYPNAEYFVLELMINSYSVDIDVLKMITNFFFYYSDKKEYQWYSRCLCIRLFIKKGKYLAKSRKVLFEKILEKLTYLETKNRIERRYVIYFLVLFGGDKGELILTNRYSLPDDLHFIKYLNIKERSL